MTAFEKAAAIERDQQWGDMKPGDPEWSDERKADALFMAGYDRRGLLNELGWRALEAASDSRRDPAFDGIAEAVAALDPPADPGLYIGPGWCRERDHHPPHDSCRGYGAGYRANDWNARILAEHDRLVREHGESCDCNVCLSVQTLADRALAVQQEPPQP
jgi:hypothetical protein